MLSDRCRYCIRALKPYVRDHRRSIGYCLFGLFFCVLWTLGAAVWPGLRIISGPSAAASTLAALATTSATAIVLALTAALIGLQILSRYGSRASRMVMDGAVGPVILVAGILGVGIPLSASVEPWEWFTVLGFACFSWGLLALAVASFLMLSRLNPRWLTLHLVRQAFPLPLSPTQALFYRLGKMQATLLDIAAGTDESEHGRRITIRAIALVGLARYRMDDKNAGLQPLVETLSARTRSSTSAQVTPEEAVAVLSLLALASDDRYLTLEVVGSLHDLVRDAVQRYRPLRRSLLDEACGLVVDRLHVLLDAVPIDWLVAQAPAGRRRSAMSLFGGPAVLPGSAAGEPAAAAIPDYSGWRAVRDWLDNPAEPVRAESVVLNALVPRYQQDDSGTPKAEPVKVLRVSTQVGPETEIPGEHSPRDADLSSRQAPVSAADNDSEANLEEVEEQPLPEAWAATLRARQRRGDAYDLLEEGVALLVSACAAPAPDDTSWPGGWRGVDALKEDVRRLASIGLSLYASERYPPTDRVERAIEALGMRIIRGLQPELRTVELPDVTGWRAGEMGLEQTTARSVTEALRELAIEAWRAGFGRRALLTIRRLVAIFVLVVKEGNAKLVEDLAGDLHLSLIRTAKWTDGSLAERERSRQLVLSLAPDFAALGQAMQLQSDDELWGQAFRVLDTAGWSPAGSEIESAADAYLYFLSGIDAGERAFAGGPADVVSWDRRPECQPRKLPPKVREQLLHQLKGEATARSPSLALVAVLALWRDALLHGAQEALEAFRDALSEDVLSGGRCDFELPEVWMPHEDITDRPPRFEGPLIHSRLFDIANEAHQWVTRKLATGQSEPAVLPEVTTPDASLRSLFAAFGAEKLVNDRQYWGIESGEAHLVLVEEADRSRRLLRDCEGRARGQFTWGYGGTGPHNLSEALLADMLGVLAYCPSCYGAIPAGGGLIKCPSCNGDGLRRRDLHSLQRACYRITSGLPKRPDPALQDSDSSPLGAQWRLTRTEFLQHAFRQVEELYARDEPDDGEVAPF
jgi:hypothetical protein